MAVGIALAAPGAGAVTFDEALGLAARAPRPAAAAAALEAKRERDQAISNWPLNPQIAAQPGFRLRPESAREPELVVEATQAWNLAGHAVARRSTVLAEEGVLEAEVRAAALAQRLGAAVAWLSLWSAERVCERLHQDVAAASELVATLERALAAGGVTRVELADARAFQAELRLRELDGEGEAFMARVDLAREMGTRAGGPLSADGPLPAPELLAEASWPALLEEVDRLPEVTLRRLRARAEILRESEEKAARGPVLQLGVLGQRDAPQGLVLSAVARVSLPVLDRGERERASLAAEAERLRGDEQAAALAARAALVAAFHEVAHTGEVLTELQEHLEPAAAEHAALRERLLRAGDGGVYEAVAARRAAVAAAVRLGRAQAEHSRARVRLYLLLSAVLSASPSVPQNHSSGAGGGAAGSSGGRP